MNTIKKSLAMLLAICMLFGVAACGKTTEADKNGSQTKTEAVQPTDGTANETQPNVTTANNDIGGGTPGLLKYRSIFYSGIRRCLCRKTTQIRKLLKSTMPT